MLIVYFSLHQLKYTAKNYVYIPIYNTYSVAVSILMNAVFSNRLRHLTHVCIFDPYKSVFYIYTHICVLVLCICLSNVELKSIPTWKCTSKTTETDFSFSFLGIRAYKNHSPCSKEQNQTKTTTEKKTRRQQQVTEVMLYTCKNKLNY